MSNIESVPYPSIRRFPSYLQVIRNFKKTGIKTISSSDIARELGLTNIQVRKDIGFTGIIGKPKIGYEIEELEDIIMESLGWHNIHDAFLVGVGALGSALLGYDGFTEYGLNIAAGFDTDKKKVGKEIHGKKIFSVTDLPGLVDRMKVTIGILTVPRAYAQETADLMINAGIKAIWNFSSERLRVPDTVVVQRENLSSSLALLSVKLSQKIKISS